MKYTLVDVFYTFVSLRMYTAKKWNGFKLYIIILYIWFL